MHLTKRERLNLQLTATQRVTRNNLRLAPRRPPAYVPEQPEAIKGHFGGKCNVTACEERGEDVKWWNRPMHAYYCSYCKREISRFDDYLGTDHAIFEPIAHVAHGQPGTSSATVTPAH
jgi:hypothetical protein